MKRFALFLIVLGMGSSLFAQVRLPEHVFATGSGSWGFVGTRLFQNDMQARLAKANFRVPQVTPMLYQFNVRYEDGVLDGHGGFGLHIFADNVVNRASWGSGASYLLWLNYDQNPITKGVPKGFSAQVYRSFSNSYMELLESYDLNQYAHLLTYENCAVNPVTAKIWVNDSTGEIRVYDPTDPSLTNYFYFYLPLKGAKLKGNWVSLRTNGIKLSFGM